MRIDNLIIGDGALGCLLLEHALRRSEHTIMVRRQTVAAGFTQQTWHSQGILHSGIRYRLEGDEDTADEMVHYVRDWGRWAGGGRTDLGKLRDNGLLRDGVAVWCPTDADVERATTCIGTTPCEPCGITRCRTVLAPEMVLDTKRWLQWYWFRYSQHIITTDSPPFGSLIDSVILDGTIVEPKQVLLAAGGDNERLLRTITGEDGPFQQSRPTVVIRMTSRQLPAHSGYVMRNGKLALVITHTKDCLGRVTWQLGGPLLANTGDDFVPEHVFAKAVEALAAVFDLRFKATTFEYTLPTNPLKVNHVGDDELHVLMFPVQRIEGHNDGIRPEGPMATCHDNVVAGWPTKLVMAPSCARMMLEDA